MTCWTRRRRTTAAIALAMAFTLAACGDDAGDETGGAGAGGSDAAGVTGVGGTASHGGGGEGGASAPEISATIGVMNVRYQEASETQGSFYAAFGQVVSGMVDGPERGCASDRWSSDDPDRPEPPPLATLDVLGVEGTLVPVTPQRAEGGAYEAFAPEPIVGLGRAIRVHGSGGGVPAFDLTQRLTARATLLAPTPERGIVRTRDLEVTWSVEGGGGSFAIYLSTETTEGDVSTLHDVRCWSPIDDGTLQIPASLLADLVGDQVRVSVVSGSESRVVVDDWLFHLGAMDVTFLAVPLHDGGAEGGQR